MKNIVVLVVCLLITTACAASPTATQTASLPDGNAEPDTIPDVETGSDQGTKEASSGAQSGGPAISTGLFLDADQAGVEVFDSDPTISRYRLVRVNFDLLGGAAGPPLDGSGVGERLEFYLFDGDQYIAVMDRKEVNQAGGFTWFGHLEGVENSQVMLVVEENVMVGKITIAKSTYSVRYYQDDIHVVMELDQAAFPPDG
jgi:hypothetical protein